MIGLDTNVLVRLLTADEAVQLKAATQLLARFEGRANSFYINDLVLVELVAHVGNCVGPFFNVH